MKYWFEAHIMYPVSKKQKNAKTLHYSKEKLLLNMLRHRQLHFIAQSSANLALRYLVATEQLHSFMYVSYQRDIRNMF
jgi:hypothetical protein